MTHVWCLKPTCNVRHFRRRDVSFRSSLKTFFCSSTVCVFSCLFVLTYWQQYHNSYLLLASFQLHSSEILSRKKNGDDNSGLSRLKTRMLTSSASRFGPKDILCNFKWLYLKILIYIFFYWIQPIRLFSPFKFLDSRCQNRSKNIFLRASSFMCQLLLATPRKCCIRMRVLCSSQRRVRGQNQQCDAFSANIESIERYDIWYESNAIVICLIAS